MLITAAAVVRRRAEPGSLALPRSRRLGCRVLGLGKIIGCHLGAIKAERGSRQVVLNPKLLAMGTQAVKLNILFLIRTPFTLVQTTNS